MESVEMDKFIAREKHPRECVPFFPGRSGIAFQKIRRPCLFAVRRLALECGAEGVAETRGIVRQRSEGRGQTRCVAVSMGEATTLPFNRVTSRQCGTP